MRDPKAPYLDKQSKRFLGILVVSAAFAFIAVWGIVIALYTSSDKEELEITQREVILEQVSRFAPSQLEMNTEAIRELDRSLEQMGYDVVDSGETVVIRTPDWKYFAVSPAIGKGDDVWNITQIDGIEYRENGATNTDA